MFWQTILAMAIIVVAADRIAAAYASWRGKRRDRLVTRGRTA